MGTIKIDSVALKEKILRLKRDKAIIDDVLEKFKKDSTIMDSYWSGNTGDMIKDSLISYTNEFDFISKKLEKYILFLEQVSKAYEDEDALIIKQMDSNGNVLMI